MNPLLQIEDLSISFVAAEGVTEAVKNISLSVSKGEIVALVGESGSGKSVTSLSILQLLPSPPAQYTSGRILFTEKETVNLLTLPPKALQEIRGNKIAMIFQEPMTSLNPVIRCGTQVAEALLQHKKMSAAEAKRKTIEWFRKVKLPQPEALYNRYPHQLSGGQKQRVVIAMAMCCEPSLLICDEPTTALDVTVQKEVLLLIKDLQQEQNMGVLFITHDLALVSEFADRVAILYKGEMVEENTADKIFRQPQQPYTKALLACRPAMHQKGDRLPVVSDFLTGKDTGLNTGKPLVAYHQQPAPDVLVRVKNLSVSFPVKKNIWGRTLRSFTAVDEVSFDIFKGETLGLVGESGCGKTTLGRTLLRLTEPSKGEIIYGDTDIIRLDKRKLQHFRKEVQLVFQDPYSSLNPRLTIGEAIEEPIKIFGLEEGTAARKKAVKELLEKVSLPGNMASRYPHQFSGGQRQRVVIARALSLHPHFLVCDESVSALDVSVQAQVLNLLNDLKKELGLTMLFISHDLSVVQYMCDRIMVMNSGKIIETGDAASLYHHPQSAYTKKLLAAVPKMI